MDPMPVVAGDAHRGHDPPYEVDYGEVVRPVYERPEPALVGFLEGAWPAWRAAGGPEVLIPDTFAVGRLARGGGRDPGGGVGRAGWFCFDTATPLVAGSFAAAAAAADAALTAADLVAGGEPAAYALCRPPGHHAGPGYSGGFCLLNNAAVAARRLAALGRVAVVDVDFHHGNGTQDIFWEDPEVLYVSLHGDPAAHYPHFTGAADEVGEGPGRGTTRNLPLPDGTGDDAYLDALGEAMALVTAFDPATLVVSAGFDTFAGDPIGAFAVTTDGFRRTGAALAAAGRPTLVVQEGGYAVEALGANAVALLDGAKGG